MVLQTLVSPAAMRGLTALVKQSSSATSRRFGGKVLYLLSSSSSSSKGSALLRCARTAEWFCFKRMLVIHTRALGCVSCYFYTIVETIREMWCIYIQCRLTTVHSVVSAAVLSNILA